MANDIQQLKIERDAPLQPRHRSGKRWLWPAALVLLLGLGYAGFSSKPLEVQTTAVSQAYPAQALAQLNATGYVVAQRKASIASKATGRLEWLGVREGSRVKRGELLARLENSDLQAAVDQAAANVETAKATLKQQQAELADASQAHRRAQGLLAQQFISSAAFDEAQARLNRARAGVAAQQAAINAAAAALKAAQVARDNSEIRAPFGGVILTKNANVGDVVAPFSSSAESKAAVVTMADMDTLEVEADVSESSLAKVSIGQPCEIQLDALPQTRLRGQVANMVPSVDRSKATVTFKIRLVEHDERVLPEMSAKVAFLSRELRPDERQPRLALNPAALAGSPPTQAWVLADGKLQRRKVLTGTRLGDYLEIRSGLKLGERVVMHPSTGLKDGASAREAEK